jgi:hypothetical protein
MFSDSVRVIFAQRLITPLTVETPQPATVLTLARSRITDRRLRYQVATGTPRWNEFPHIAL